MKEVSEAVYTMSDPEGTLHIEYDDITTRTKLFLTQFGSTFGTLGFDEKSFFNTITKFSPYWDFEPTISIQADSSGVMILVMKF